MTVASAERQLLAFAKRSGKKKASRGRNATRARSKTVSSQPKEWSWAVSLSLLAWAHRLVFLHSNATDRGWAYTLFYRGDAQHFFLWSDAMLSGETYDNGIPFHPPGFALVLAILRWFLGQGPESYFAVKASLALVSSMAIGLLFLLVRPYLGHRLALATALLSTYHFGLYVVGIATASEGVFMTLLMATLLLWSRTLDHPLAAPGQERRSVRFQCWAGLGVGLCSGWLALIRAEAVLTTAILIAVGFVGARHARPRTKALAPWLLIIIGSVAVIAPWTARNATTLSAFNQRLGDRLAEPLPTFVPITLYGPLNLALANHDRADGSFSPDLLMKHTGSGQLQLSNPVHLDYFLHGDRLAFDWIRQHPMDFLRLAVRKWQLMGEVSTLGFGQANWPGGLVGTRRPVDVFVPDRKILAWAFVPMTVLGFIVGITSGRGVRQWTLVSGLLVGATMIVTALFFGYVRQGVIILPFLLSLIALGGSWVLGKCRDLLLADRSLPVPSRGWLFAGLATVLLIAIANSRSERHFARSQDPERMLNGQRINGDATVRIERVTAPQRR